VCEDGRERPLQLPTSSTAGTSVGAFSLSQLSSKPAPFSVVGGKGYPPCLAADSTSEKGYRRISLIYAWLTHPKSSTG